MWVFSECGPPILNVDKDFHPAFLDPVKALPKGKSFLKWHELIINPLGFSSWDKIDIQGPMTLQGIIDFFREKYGIKLSIIAMKAHLLYCEAIINIKAM